MRRIILSALILLSLPASRAEAQSWSGIGNSGSTVSAVFFMQPGTEGSLYCFNVQVNFGSVGPQMINGEVNPGSACRWGYQSNGGAFAVSVTPGFNTGNSTVTFRALRDFQQVAVITLSPPPPPPPPPEPEPDPEPALTPGSSPIRAPKRTDTTFLATGPGLRTSCTFAPLLRFTIAVDRVVGDVNTDGSLVDPQTLIANGVVSQTTMLRVPAFDVDVNGGLPSPVLAEVDHVFVNGEFVGSLTGASGAWQDNRFIISTDLIRFGTRNPGAAPTPGLNEIEILIDVANAANGKSYYCTAVDWAALSFDALAPTIMVHGNNSEGAFFDDLHNAGGEQLGFHFVEPFRQQQLPFDNTINMPTASVSNHAALLGTLIPARAAEFGARHVHLVAHSKGGLDLRAFLAGWLPPNFGVLSLTTLSTPHRGSAGADYSIDASQANALFSQNTTRTLLAQQLPPDAGTPDLRVSAAAAFNAVNAPLLPRTLTVDGVTRPVVYWSVSADANLDHSVADGSPTIQINETRGTSQGQKPDAVWAPIMQTVYRVMGEVASTALTTRRVLGRTIPVVTETPTTQFQLNDFLVTMTGARMTGFRELTATPANHATVANPITGQVVINTIRFVQPLREPQ